MNPQALVRYYGWSALSVVTKQLVTLDRDGAVSVPRFKVDAFAWKHRDIKLVRTLARAVFRGNTTQLAWAWSSATRAP